MIYCEFDGHPTDIVGSEPFTFGNGVDAVDELHVCERCGNGFHVFITGDDENGKQHTDQVGS